MVFTAFLDWLCNGDVASFYQGLRWDGWESEVEPLALTSGIMLFPPPSTVEGQPVSRARRTVVPMNELARLYHPVRAPR